MRETDYKVKVVTGENGTWFKTIWTDLDGRFHREGNLPAIEYSSGQVDFFIKGVRHNEFGPAIIRPDGHVDYYLEGIFYTKESFQKEINKRNELKKNSPCHGKIVEIEGKKYKLNLVE